jgi:tRNA(fMet)-specific endonuclease VapC
VTEPQFLIDSNIAIYILEDAQGAPAWRVQSMPVGSIVTSAIVYAEVMRGIPLEEEQARHSADALFRIIRPLPFDIEAAGAYCRLPFKRASFDRLIAAHALSLGLTLVTNNQPDFSYVPGLKVENWTR